MLLECTASVNLLTLSKLLVYIAIFAGITKYSEAYRHFINTKDSLELFFLKFLFLGPPRLGKTTVRRRLMGEIEDIKSAGEAGQPQPSTGTVETGHSVVVKTVSNTAAVLTESEWSAIASLEDEACMLFHNLVDKISSKSSTPLEAFATANEALPNRSVHRDDESSLSQSNTDSLHLGNQSRHKKIPDAHRPNPSLSPTMFSQDMLDITTLFNEAMGSAYWKDVKHMFKAHLRMEDTGGQPELMDMLPALTIGPGLYLLFINLQNELDEHYKLSYCSASGESTPSVNSTYTVMEMLYSAMSSICCSKTIPTNIFDDENIMPELNNILESSHSVAYVVGTHKDKVTEERIKILNKQLKEKITSTAFYSQNILQFSSEDDLIVTVDNMEGGKDEICHVRALLEKAMERHFKKLKIPAVWLLFSLFLRKMNMRTAKLDFCIQKSRMLNMSEYETKVAIWFLHHHAGVMMYFPNIPELKDLVIIDIQIVYDSVTILILRAMNYEEVGHCNAKEFKKTGQFALSHIIAATAKVSGELIPPQKLVALLEYLHIIARVPDSSSRGHTVSSCYKQDDVTYIMPCVLENVTTEELDSVSQDISRPDSVAPIMLYFTCGFVPIGVFPAMIASLISNKSFEFIKKGIKKNMVRFHFGRDCNLITLICRPQYFMIQMPELSSDSVPVNEECVAIKNNIETTLKKVGSHMNYGSFMDYQFSFKCPLHPGGDHPCVVKKDEVCPRVMRCLRDRDQPEPVKLSGCHQIWFSQVCLSFFNTLLLDTLCISLFRSILRPDLVLCVSFKVVVILVFI